MISDTVRGLLWRTPKTWKVNWLIGWLTMCRCAVRRTDTSKSMATFPCLLTTQHVMVASQRTVTWPQLSDLFAKAKAQTLCHSRVEQKRKEQTLPFGIDQRKVRGWDVLGSPMGQVQKLWCEPGIWTWDLNLGLLGLILDCCLWFEPNNSWGQDGSVHHYWVQMFCWRGFGCCNKLHCIYVWSLATSRLA